MIGAMFLTITLVLSPAPERPYISCIDGHIVEKLSDCPPMRDNTKPTPAPIGGGPTRGGLLGLGIGGIL